MNSIRPDNLTAKLDEASKKDHQWYQDHSTEFVQVNCPACDTAPKPTDRIINKFPAIYHECENCKTLYITPRPTIKIYEDFYHNSEILRIFSEEIFPNAIDNRMKLIYIPRLKKIFDHIKKFNIPTDTFLEIGAGSGVFSKLISAENRFKKVIAIEPSKPLANDIRAIAKEYTDIEVIEKMIENIDPTEVSNVTVAGSFEVIEHLFSPYAYLQAIYNILPASGALFLSTPNSSGFDVMELQELSSTLGITHCNLFNTQSIKILLERASFKVLDISTPGILDADIVARAIKNGEYKISEKSFLYKVLMSGDEELKNNFQNFLSDNNLSSHQWIIAIK